jgi:hypothetical protein
MNSAVRPNGVNHPLTRATLDKYLRFAHNSHLNRISNPVLQIIVSFFPRSVDNICICTIIHRPSRSQGKCEVQHTVSIVSEDTNGKDFAKGGARAGDGGGEGVVVSDEADPVKEDAENDGHVACTLYREIFFDKWLYEGVGDIWGSQLVEEAGK